MPLLIASLKASPGLPGAGTNGDLDSGADVAQKWAAAVGSWADGIVPASTTVTAAKSALQSTLAGLFATQRSTPAEVAALAASLETAHLTFATTVAVGMAPAYTGVPPVAPVGFAGILAAASRETSQDAADAIADALDTWMRTGSATLNSPPGTVSLWA